MVTPFGQQQTFHSHFNQPYTQTFTSTLKPSFNVWPIILTAGVFFTVLTWYNVFLALYEYYFFDGQEKEQSRDNLKTLLGFGIFWTIVVILSFIWLNSKGLLAMDKNNEIGDNIQPSSSPSDLLSEAMSPI